MSARPSGRLTSLLATTGMLLAGCQGVPADALKLPPDAAVHRPIQTHRYEDVPESRLLSAGLGVLQDLGFTLEGSESRLGLITGSRKLTSRRPLRSDEVVKRMFGLALIPYLAPFAAYEAVNGVEEPQIVRVCLVTRPESGASPPACVVRVTAQRIVYTNKDFDRVLLAEPLDDPQFYREFFRRLSLSVFLEGQKT